MKDTDRTREKAKGGYFVGAQFVPELRKKINIKDRYVLSYDIDAATDELIGNLRRGTTALGDVEYFVYSTFSSTKAQPKIRVVVLLSEPIHNDKFQALSRIIGEKIDPGLQCIDRVSFVDAQFMYWPAHMRDVKPINFHNNTGVVVDPDVALAEFGDWQDYSKLPKSPREAGMREAGAKAQNPTEKKGLIGALCRLYTIPEAIEKWLSDFYEPFEGSDSETRYTYKLGSGFGGAIVYDGGLHLYSQHGTDPCGLINVNLFDMLRKHLFGEFDAKVDEDEVKGTDLPSYKKMMQWIRDNVPEVTAEVVETNYEDAEDVADDSFSAAPDALAQPVAADLSADISLDVVQNYDVEDQETFDWKKSLDLTADGATKSTLPNVALILSYSERFRGRLAYNLFSQEQVLLKPISSKTLRVHVEGPTERQPVVPVDTQVMNVIRIILESPTGKGKKGFGLKVSDRDLEAAVDKACRANPVHPIRDYLTSLAWDGVERMSLLWIKACHTPDTPYFRETATKWLSAAVARVMEPGCKFDYAPIIEGPQGLFKSTLLALIGGWRYTASIEAEFENTAKWVEATRGAWIIELPELVQFSKGDLNVIKKRMSDTHDKVRLAYGKREGVYPRQSVMAGTTNDDAYLRDQTGNRRVWPIPCGPGPIDIQWVTDNIAQIWGEAVQSYIAIKKRSHNQPHLSLHLEDDEAVAEALRLQGSRMVEDGSRDIAGLIEVWLETRVRPGREKCGVDDGEVEVTTDPFDPSIDESAQRDMTCAVEIWVMALGRDEDKYDQRAAQGIIAPAMRKLSKTWHPSLHARHCGRWGKVRAYLRIGSNLDRV